MKTAPKGLNDRISKTFLLEKTPKDPKKTPGAKNSAFYG
jgi:hypothetical protein